MFETTLFLLSSELMQIQTRVPPYLLFLFPCFHSLMIDFSFLKIKTLKNQMPISFVVIALLLLSLINLALQLNITSQRFFIFLNFPKTSILLLQIQDYQEVLFYDQKTSGSILVSFLTGNSSSINIFIFTPTKPYPQLRI